MGTINRYISDLHLFHSNVLKFDNRPFSNIEEMENTIITDWNNTINKNDCTYILGDLIWSKNDSDWIRITKSLNGSKVLIKGNHDLKQYSASVKSCFTDIKDYKEISDNGRKVIMCHYPIMCYKSSYNDNVWMLHGHVHGQTEETNFVEKWTRDLITTSTINKGHIINVGCMMPGVNYIPKTLDEYIILWHKKYQKELKAKQ